jgi:hypothetical protein
MRLRLLILASILGSACCAYSVTEDESLHLSWTNNLLTVASPKLPGGKLDIWYPEAFCRKGSTDRDWSETVWNQKTVLGRATSNDLYFRTTIESDVSVGHHVAARANEITITYCLYNTGKVAIDLEWFQPACIRVGAFTGCNQSNYTARSFIFTERGLTTLDKTDRRPETEARYHGGQVYVPKGINTNDVNPRPLSRDYPTNGLIGCFSADGKYLLAVASDNTHELFEGVYVCLHSDPHVGGLKPGRWLTGGSRIYFMSNDIPALLKRYQTDFHDTSKSPAGF